MKALSLRQPWAEFVLKHGKRVENRRWSTKFRGPFLIHAARGCSEAEHEEALWSLEKIAGRSAADAVPPWRKIDRGGFVGQARVVDVIPPRPLLFPCDVDQRWHFEDQFGFILEDVARLTFYPWPGALGFFEVPDRVVVDVLASPVLP